MKHAFVDATLTAAERAAPFLIAASDPEPLEAPTRLARLVEDGREFEIDPATGAVLAIRAEGVWPW